MPDIYITFGGVSLVFAPESLLYSLQLIYLRIVYPPPESSYIVHTRCYIWYLGAQKHQQRPPPVIMREMATGANGFFTISCFFLVFFCAPRCHLTDGCHLTHTVR